MYFLLETDDFKDPRLFNTRLITDRFGYQPTKWIAGRQLKPVVEPFEFELWGSGTRGLGELFLDSVPLFRNDLLEVIEHCGVDNLQKFRAILRGPDGLEKEGYSAVNIQGLVKCADLAKSEYGDVGGIGAIAMSFRKLVIDEQAARGQLFFRLGEAVSEIIVHQRVKEAIDKASFQYLSWRPLTA
jgi:hypothetical protein